MLKRNIKTQSQRKKKGQSTVEYIILVAAIIGALIIFLGPAGTFRGAYDATLESGTNGMEGMAGRLSGSRGTDPTP